MTKAKSNFVELAKKQAAIFEERSVAWMDVAVESSCIKTTMIGAYNVLTRSRKMKDIESMEAPDKLILWERAKEIAQGKLNKEELIEFCKVLITLEYFLT